MPALRTSRTQKTKHEPVLLNIGLAVIRNIKKALGAINDPERKYYPSAPADWLEIPGSYPNLRAAWITKKYTARWFKFVELQRELRHKADEFSRNKDKLRNWFERWRVKLDSLRLRRKAHLRHKVPMSGYSFCEDDSMDEYLLKSCLKDPAIPKQVKSVSINPIVDEYSCEYEDINYIVIVGDDAGKCDPTAEAMAELYRKKYEYCCKFICSSPVFYQAMEQVCFGYHKDNLLLLQLV
ncbi:4110_t:CDS:1 [Paraglomus brasilianum]|uniref:4110_t:CDS:1 n=1 Tax=Paraglomus brasilianum TaxID=144538 RepID=A0A9N9C781_9GLOM|nr:4110_t:CDS:1 [Paraglomus brasilianum]